ncbi:MAG: hypothetical protein ACYCW6_31565, partial [Candidatus Xenobia bacterium]
LLLTFCYLCFGRHDLPYLLIQIGLDVATACIWFRRVRLMFGDRMAIVTSLLFLLAPYEAAFSTLLLTETLTVFLVVAWLDRTLHAAEHPGAGSFAVMGALAALIVLTRPALLLMTVCGGIWLLYRTRAWRAGLAALAMAALLLVPWVVRNTLAFGRPTASAAASLGVSMYLGVTSDGNVWLTHDGDATFRDDLQQWSRRGDLPARQALEDDDALRRYAWQAILQHPQAWSLHVVQQALALLWNPEDAIQDTSAGLPFWLTDFGFQLCCGMQRLLVLLALLGAWRARARLGDLAMPLLSGAVLVAGYALIHVEARFVLPLEPVLALLAALAIADPPEEVEEAGPAPPWVARSIVATTLVLAAAMLFSNLGGTPLWGDEAGTAMIAEGVWQTGDTTAVIGHNVMAYHGGIELDHLKERYMPPAQYYLVAPAYGVAGNQPGAVRFPEALLGLLLVAGLGLWALRARFDTAMLLLLASALLGNVSFFLFMRQCRYYAPAVVGVALVAWLWLHHRGRWIDTLLCGLAGAFLMASHYGIYAATAAALGLDSLLWGRRLPWSHWAALIGSQALVAAALLSVWNPLAPRYHWVGGYLGGSEPAANPWLVKAIFLWRGLRDLNGCEMVCSGFVLLAVWMATKDVKLRRVLVGTACFLLVTTAITPTPIWRTNFFEVRYLVPLILPGCYLTARSLALLVRHRLLPAAVLSGLLLLTNVACVMSNCSGAYDLSLRSTSLEYVRELLHPRVLPQGVAAAWLQNHVPAGRMVWVQPEMDIYPLMFAVPQLIYGWQLDAPTGQFAGLNPAWFKGVQPPDVVVVYGPTVRDFRRLLATDWKRLGLAYREVARDNVYWDDESRPELLWHSFGPVPVQDPETQGVYIFERIDARGQNLSR